jgi:2-succinyl-6-hydroxy-2,4-cyclohexadiene-1-carboxylate synthase
MRLVLVHGFSQTPAAWGKVRRHLPASAGGEPVDVVTPHVPDALDFNATARTIAEACGPGIYVGYSMGGRLCLRIALDLPDLLRGLVLVSSSPGIADDDARAERAVLDGELARQAMDIGAGAFVKRWLENPLFVTLEPGADEVIERTRAYSAERLAHQLRALGQGVQEPLWHRLGELAMRVAIVTGRADPKYDVIGNRMARCVRLPLRVRIDGGHSLPLEQPEALAGVLLQMVRDAHGHDSVS